MTAMLPTEFGDLPLSLLAKLDLARPMLNDADDRPACTGKFAEGWFDLAEKSRFYNVAETGTRAPKRIPEQVIHAAHQYCRACPVREACARYADDHQEEGLWGGQYRRRGSRSDYDSYDLLSLDVLDFLPAENVAC